jgi:hypothetical protein
MPTNLAIDDTLIEEAKQVGRHKTKKEAVTTALQEYVERRRRLRILDLIGTVDFDPDFDYKQMRRKKRHPWMLSSTHHARFRSRVLEAGWHPVRRRRSLCMKHRECDRSGNATGGRRHDNHPDIDVAGDDPILEMKDIAVDIPSGNLDFHSDADGYLGQFCISSNRHLRSYVVAIHWHFRNRSSRRSRIAAARFVWPLLGD